jgi:hypothetical protein
MNDRSELFRSLDAEEAASLAPLPDSESDTESPTTSRSELGSEATGEVHYPGVVASYPRAAEGDDTVPNPHSVSEGE